MYTTFGYVTFVFGCTPKILHHRFGINVNVFVLNTGRCGSTTFIQACTHIHNFTCAHESRTHLLGDERFRYPENHIEADNRLSWLLGRLDKVYGNNAFYVHLKRSETETARSFVKRYSSGIIRAYRGSGIIMGLPETTDPFLVARDYCKTVNANIELFLRDKDRKVTINLEEISPRFPEFAEHIGAVCDMEAVKRELTVQHNATSTHKDHADSVVEQRGGRIRQLLKRVSKIR